MVREMKLKGTVHLELDRSLTFSGQLYDGTGFSMRVDPFDVQLSDEFTPERMTVGAYLFVRQEAQQGDICYLTLPKPCIPYGRQITVREMQLMPRHATLADFNPTKRTPASQKPLELLESASGDNHETENGDAHRSG